MHTRKDDIFAKQARVIKDFSFNHQVAEVFEDMITRSIPGYSSIIHMIGVLAGQYAQDSTLCYDLGCSLGASSLSIAKNVGDKNVKIQSIDNSKAMIEKCRVKLASRTDVSKINLICEDIRSTKIHNASIVVMNFILQFIEVQDRDRQIQKIYNGLNPGGILILSEKICFANADEQERQENLYHQFKKLNGYSDLEIAQKRTALENVLIPDTLAAHQNRLAKAGFTDIHVWFQCFNFISLFAIK